MPDHDDLVPLQTLSRRELLSLLGATAAFAAGCSRPAEKLLPHTQPVTQLPGEPVRYATASVIDGLATGLLATTVDGRPVKLDGHPGHPASLGGSGAMEQAMLLGLYDPKRLQTALHRGATSTWEAFRKSLPPADAPVHVLLEPTSSDLRRSLLASLRTARPSARVYFDAPLASTAARAFRRLAGAPLRPVYKLDRAKRIVSLASDFLAQGPFWLRYARDWASHRSDRASLNRLYAVESTLTVTGMSADVRLAVPPSRVETIARALLATIRGEAPPSLDPDLRDRVRAIARDLSTHRGASVVVANETGSDTLHALAYLLNDALGNAGRTVDYVPSPVEADGDDSAGLDALMREVEAGRVKHLFVLGANPAYTRPSVRELLARIEHLSTLTTHVDETSALAEWVVPRLHPLESWADGRALDGTVTFAQPLVRPLVAGHTIEDVLDALAGTSPRRDQERLRTYWEPKLPNRTDWTEAIREGFVPGSATPPGTVTLEESALGDLLRPRAESDRIELEIRPDPRLHDGRFATNAWLQELPEPVTKQTWGNAALVSPLFAAGRNLVNGDVVTIVGEGGRLELPVFVLPGQAESTVTIATGHGRRFDSSTLVGVSAFELQSGPVQVERTGRREPLAITQTHDIQSEPEVARATVRSATDWDRAPAHENPLSFFAEKERSSPQWAMAIDLGRCTGCSACVVACQSENNIPPVGREGVLRGREMHWLRIDRYFTHPPDGPRAVTQPMLCQHCEHAPCEYVCPVNATTHSPDGLNEMTYNRCVGTRFCSNNCPYKVRRFNWFNYTRTLTPTERLAMNPQVTVRARGVMEKCTFCVQRIRRAEIAAERQGRRVRDGDVHVACEEACPTRAITFGDLTDPESPVTRLAKDGRAYQVLDELGTRPRVRYLARVLNAPEDA